MKQAELFGKRARSLRKRRIRVRLFAAVLAVGLLGGGVAAWAAVSQVNQLTVCVAANGSVTRFNPYEGDCPGNTQEVKWKVDGVAPTTAATTTTPATTTTTTTQPTTGTVIPGGRVCPTSDSDSFYVGNRLTTTQAVQVLWAGGFRTLTDLRAYFGIASAESSLCPNTRHTHPPGSCVDRGLLQINSCSWPPSKSPLFADAQVFDPVGAARAAHAIDYDFGGSYFTWDTWRISPFPARNAQPTAAFVCSVEPSATGC